MKRNTDEWQREAARLRMFDVDLLVALESMGGVAPMEGVAASRLGEPNLVTHRGTHPMGMAARTRTRSLFAVAVALVALAVTVCIAWQQSEPRVQAQDPAAATAAMPPLRWIIKPSDLARLPVASENLGVYTNAIEDYQALAAFPHVRHLMFLGAGVPKPTAATLAPLGTLPKLEELQIPLQADMLPVHLQALAKASNVHSLHLRCQRAITAADIRSLKLMPKLRVLRLSGGALDGETIRALSDLPHLDELGLQDIGGCSEAVLLQLRMLHRLRRLALFSLGEQPLVEQFGATTTPAAGLTPAIAKVLSDLPLLEELQLVSCKLTTTALAALPNSLRRIQVVRCPDIVAEQLLELRHVRGLTELGLDSTDITRWGAAIPQDFLRRPADLGDAQAVLIRELPLRRLDYASEMPRAVRLAVAANASLTHIALTWFVREDLEALAAAKNLQHLTLCDGRGIALVDLQLLRRCASLATITIEGHNWTAAEIAAQLPGIKVLTKHL